jgi:hypothetical protein
MTYLNPVPVEHQRRFDEAFVVLPQSGYRRMAAVWVLSLFDAKPVFPKAREEIADDLSISLLKLLVDRPGMTIRQMAEGLELFYKSGALNISRAYRMVKRLEQQGLIELQTKLHLAETTKGK